MPPILHNPLELPGFVAWRDGERIGHIRLPETTANFCFGGPKRNRLMMAASQSIYAVYVNIKGAHIT